MNILAVGAHPDHELTSKIINDIAVMIPVEKIKTKNPAYDKIPIIAYFEPANGLEFVPTDYVDITDTMAGKDIFENYYTIAKYRGIQCGVQYAEGFRMANDAFRVVPYRVLP